VLQWHFVAFGRRVLSCALCDSTMGVAPQSALCVPGFDPATFQPAGFGDIYSVQLSVTPTDERTCVTDTCSIFTEDPFPLCFSRTTSNNKTTSPHSWAVFSGSSSPPPLGVSTQCAPPPPVSTGGFGLPPGACLHAHTRPLPFREAGMPCFSPTSRCWPFAPYEACIIVIPLTHPYRLCSKFLRPKAL
jgi:hypothetical protein